MTGFDKDKLYRFFIGKYSDEDESYVNEVFCDKNNEIGLKKKLENQFDELIPEDEMDQKNLDHILYRIHYDINTRLPSRKIRPFNNLIKWTLGIAGVLLPLVIFFVLNSNKESLLKNKAWVEIQAPAWTRAQFSLPDGTTGWLNSNSSIKYSWNFIDDRQITLKGEAYFDVYKDKKKPFIVKTPDIKVRVLGTRFNIASYDNEKKVEVVLEEGRLVFNNEEMNKSYTMKPNDLVIYDKTLKVISIEIVRPQKYLSWTEGKLIFRNDPLDVVARRLERWYNIEVELDVKSTEDFKWRATFIDEGLDEVLALLKASFHVEYSIKNPYLKPDHTFTKKKVIIRQIK